MKTFFNIRTGRTLQRNGEKYLPLIKDEDKKRIDVFIKECTQFDHLDLKSQSRKRTIVNVKDSCDML